MPGVVTPGGRIGDPSPVGTPGGKQNWVDKAGGLPTYIRMVAHALIRQGKSESAAIATAVATMKRWAAGGGNVSAKVRAAAAAAIAEFEAKRGASDVKKSTTGEIVELLKAETSPVGREMLSIIKGEKFGRVPVEDISHEHVVRAARAATANDDPATDRPVYAPDNDMDEDDQKYIMQNASDANLKVAWADLHRQHTSGYGDQRSRIAAHKAKNFIEKEQQRRAKITKSAPKKKKPAPKTILTKKEFEAAAALVASGSSGRVKKSENKADVTMQGEIIKSDNEKRLVFGWASVGIRKDGKVVIDKQEDFIDDPDEIEKAAYNFVLHSRDGGEMHIRKGVSTLVESFVITPEKRKILGIPDGVLPQAAWWTGWKVHDEDVWKGVKSGKYKMFSVHGKGTRKRVEV